MQLAVHMENVASPMSEEYSLAGDQQQIFQQHNEMSNIHCKARSSQYKNRAVGKALLPENKK